MGDVRIKNKEGETFIPATRRADGTWRKARKDEQPKYDIKARLNKTGLPSTSIPTPTPNRTYYSAQKTVYGANFGAPVFVPKPLINEEMMIGPQIPVAFIDKPNACITVRDQYEKQLFSIRRKIEDIQQLVDKIDKGLLIPQPNQLEKIKRRPILELQVSELLDKIEKL
uniref:Partner of Y14 and mago n=1 Tax=Rhabditophanes sp. KR3021 TaxID=114890 RepID=A0AC35U4B6_9BILA